MKAEDSAPFIHDWFYTCLLFTELARLGPSAWSCGVESPQDPWALSRDEAPRRVPGLLCAWSPPRSLPSPRATGTSQSTQLPGTNSLTAILTWLHATASNNGNIALFSGSSGACNPGAPLPQKPTSASRSRACTGAPARTESPGTCASAARAVTEPAVSWVRRPGPHQGHQRQQPGRAVRHSGPPPVVPCPSRSSPPGPCLCAQAPASSLRLPGEVRSSAGQC